MNESERMKAFILALFDKHYECDLMGVDGGDLQDLAEEHGILVPELHHEPCSDQYCRCAEDCYPEDWAEGINCYRLADWLTDRPSVGPIVE